MKFNGIPGEFCFKALFKTNNGWELSDNYYFQNPWPDNIGVKWPVEVYEDGSVRVVDKEELDEKETNN